MVVLETVVDSIEKNYNMRRLIEAEEEVLASAACVIASTRQEAREQYAVYDYYQPRNMEVIGRRRWRR